MPRSLIAFAVGSCPGAKGDRPPHDSSWGNVREARRINATKVQLERAASRHTMRHLRWCAPHVAVVEDDASVRRALTRVLSAANFEVTAFGSAEEFLLCGLDPLPDCILVDIHLPLMNGMELQRRVNSLLPTISVVFLTADHDWHGANSVREGGCG